MKILVYGMGAIGSVFAARLSTVHEVVGICRGEHYKVIKDRGLKLSGETQGTFIIKVAESLDDVGEEYFDLVLVTTKSYDLRKSLKKIKESISFSHILAIQNGLNTAEILTEEIRNADILVGVTYNAATLEAPGIVKHAYKGKTYIASLRGSEFQMRLASVLSDVGLPSEVPQDIFKIIWEKAAVNCVINPLTAILYEKNKIIVELWDELLPIIESIIDEIIEAAKIFGVNLPQKECLIEKVKKVSIYTGENISSMLQDLQKGKRTEIDALNCYVANVLRRKGHNETVNWLLCTIIKELEKKSIKS